jgi:hypothetical protein
MLFQNAERQQAGALGLLDGRAEVCGCEFFPVHGQLALRPAELGAEGQEANHDYDTTNYGFAEHGHATRGFVHGILAKLRILTLPMVM